MNNLEELCKPVAEVTSKYGDPEAFGERELNVLADIQKMPYRTKFYSQEYVDALIAQLEAAQKLISEDGKLQYIRRLEAEITDWRSVAEAAAQDDVDWHKLTDSKNEVIVNLAFGVGLLINRAEKAEAELSAANEKLSKPVKLPKTNGYWNAEEQAFERGIQLARQEIRIAGFRVEGDE